MTRVRFYGATSLDGFLAVKDHDLSWLLSLPEPTVDTYTPFIAEVGAICMGSQTYEWLLRQVGTDAWPYSQPTWVFTTRQLPPTEADVRFVRGDVAPVHALMAAAADGKDIWLVGGGELVGQFYDAGLLDEFIVQIAAVTLGAGLPAFPRPLVKPPLRLTSVQQIGEAFVELRYEVPKPDPDSW